MEPRDARCWDHCRVPHAPNPRPCVGMATTALSPLPLREGRHCPHHSPWNERSVTHPDSMVWAAKPGSPPTSSCQEEEGKALWGFEDRGGLCLPYCRGKYRWQRLKKHSTASNGIIHNNQKMGTAQMSISGQVDKQHAVYSYSGMSLGHEKEPGTGYNMDRP